MLTPSSKLSSLQPNSNLPSLPDYNGFLLVIVPAIVAFVALANAPTDHESLNEVLSADQHAAEVDVYLQNHSLIKSLRVNLNYRKSKSHLRIVKSHRIHSFTADKLMSRQNSDPVADVLARWQGVNIDIIPRHRSLRTCQDSA